MRPPWPTRPGSTTAPGPARSSVPFPEERPRRLRRTAALRRLVRETDFSARQLVLPLFVHEAKGPKPIASLPGHARLGLDGLAREAEAAAKAGLGGVLLFGIPSRKSADGAGASDPEGLVPRAVRRIRKAVGADLTVITDTCLCAYTDHGHCGIVRKRPDGFSVDNDASLDRIAAAAVAQARSGADLVAPSDMMDGRVAAIRRALDRAGLAETGILSYAVKFASAFYGPFRDAAGSAPAFGDRRTYQMDPANAREAVREALLDVGEGADLVMVKPALAYLDLVRRVREAVKVPVAAYSVSGEYAMVKAAAAKGWLDEEAAAMEILTGIRRAGADLILTYWAKDAARWLMG